MALTRVAHWDTNYLTPFLDARRDAPFTWGENDCALFAADGILAMTGVDIAADFRGRYHNETAAFELIHSVTGGRTVADAAAWCAEKFEIPEWPGPLYAQRGDLVALEDGGRLIVGLVHPNGRHIVAAGELGLKRLPFAAGVRAWRV